MGAFYDIWLGRKGLAPRYKRLENDGWQAAHHGAMTINTSLPLNANASFISKTVVDGYCMIILGQFYEKINTTELINRCAKFIENKTPHYDDPAGHYIIFLLDTKKDLCHVFTNRFGTYHAYWNTDGVLGTYFMGMARQSSSKTLDWEGVTGFLGMGFFPGSKTYLNAIKILAPASYYCFDRDINLVLQKKYWQWQYNTCTLPVSQHLQQLNETLQGSVSYALQNQRVALPISGGLDSRMLAGTISDIGNVNYSSLWGYSYGYTDNSIETNIAGRIAKAKKIAFDKYVVSNYLFKKMDTIIDSVDLFQYVDGTRQASVKEILERKSDVVVGGHWGDVWMNSMGIDEAMQNSLTTAFEKKIIKKGSDWLIDEVCSDHLKNGADYLYDYFNTTVNKYDHIPDADLKFKAFKTDEWSFRWTLASVRMYQAAVFPVLPFYDKRVADLLIRVPADMLKGRRFQIEYIKNFHPDLAKVKWQEYGRNLYSYKYINNRNIAYRAVNKMKRVLTGAKPVLRNWEIFYLNDSGRKNLENIVLQGAITEVVSAVKIRSLINDFYSNPSAANGYRISMLHTFAQFLKKLHE